MAMFRNQHAALATASAWNTPFGEGSQLAGWCHVGAQSAMNKQQHAVMINLDQYSEASDSDSEVEPPVESCGKKADFGACSTPLRDTPEPVPEPDSAPTPSRPLLQQPELETISAPWRRKEARMAGSWTDGDWAALLSADCKAPRWASLPWRRSGAAANVPAAVMKPAKLPSRGMSGISSASTEVRDSESDQEDRSDRSVSEPEAEAAEAAQNDAEPAGADAAGTVAAVHRLLPWRAAAETAADGPLITADFVDEAPKEPSAAFAAPVSTPAARATPVFAQPAAAESPAFTPALAPEAAEESCELLVSPNSWAAQMRARRSAPAAISPTTPGALGRRMDERGALMVSSNSWAAQQRARRSLGGGAQEEDAEVVRSLKSLLNKLTLEKFEDLSIQIMQVPMRNAGHVELLITEVFEKAITQHHFIDMYADLCALLHEHFITNPVGNDAKFSFKKLLLNECQKSFERNLEPPKGLRELDPEERTLREFRYKHRMIGNIKFIGALLVRKMLAGKVLLAILQELISDPTPEALESAAALLTATGPVFDSAEWAFRGALEAIFCEVGSIIQQPTCEPRSRCLLKDVLDLRASGWKESRRKTQDAPTTLREVSERKAAEEGSFKWK